MIPQGLSLQVDVITKEKENEIITYLDSKIWSTELSRRTQHYGYQYNYKHKDLIPGPPLERPILELAQIIERTELMKPVQCIVNEYYRNQGIAPHIDSLIFGKTIMSISLGADVVMNFTYQDMNYDCFLPRRSAMMITDSARYEWKHSIARTVTYVDSEGNKVIKAQDYRRISLTYRELVDVLSSKMLL